MQQKTDRAQKLHEKPRRKPRCARLCANPNVLLGALRESMRQLRLTGTIRQVISYPVFYRHAILKFRLIDAQSQ